MIPGRKIQGGFGEWQIVIFTEFRPSMVDTWEIDD